MRVKDIYEILESSNKKLTLNFTGVDQDTTKVTNVNSYISELKRIRTTNLFRNELLKYEKLEKFYLSKDDTVLLSKQNADALGQYNSDLGQKITILLTQLPALIGEESENTISISLPEVRSLSETIKFLEEINTMMDQLFANNWVKGEVKFAGLDRGSSWVDLLFTTENTYLTMAAVVMAGLGAINLHLRNQKLRVEIEEKNIDIEIKRRFLAELDKETREQATASAKEIVEKFTIEKETDRNEYIQRVKEQILKVKEFIERGVKFIPSFKTKSELKKVLPDFRQPLNELVETHTKLLESKNR